MEHAEPSIKIKWIMKELYEHTSELNKDKCTSILYKLAQYELKSNKELRIGLKEMQEAGAFTKKECKEIREEGKALRALVKAFKEIK